MGNLSQSGSWAQSDPSAARRVSRIAPILSPFKPRESKNVFLSLGEESILDKSIAGVLQILQRMAKLAEDECAFEISDLSPNSLTSLLTAKETLNTWGPPEPDHSAENELNINEAARLAGLLFLDLLQPAMDDRSSGKLSTQLRANSIASKVDTTQTTLA